MRNKTRKIATKAILIVLVLTMILSICSVVANAAGTEETSTDDYGYISIKVIPMLKGFGEKYLKTSAASESSIIENVTYDSSGNLIVKESNYGFRVEATYYVNGAVSTDKKVYVYVQEKEPQEKIREIKSKAKASGIGTTTYDKSISLTESEVYYITATTDDGNYAVNSVTVQIAHKAAATSTARYHRAGMQIRGIDNVAIGKYDYISSKGATKNVSNTNGIYQTETGTFTDSNGQSYTLGTYEGLDGKEYPECYFDVKIDSLDDGLNTIAGITNLKELYNWIGSVYLPAANKIGAEISNTLVIKGPEYLDAVTGTSYATGTNKKTYNMEYYQTSDTSGINTYASWSATTKSDFVTVRYVTMVIPNIASSKIKINCYDEDDPTTLLSTTSISSDEFRVSGSNLLTNVVNSTLPSGSSTTKYRDGNKINYDALKADASTLTLNDSGKLESNTTAASKLIASMTKEGHDTVVAKIPSSSAVDYVTIQKVTIPTMDGYTFDFGYAMDGVAASSSSEYAPLYILAGTKNVNIVCSENSTDITLNLYYKGSGNTTYKVIVTNNGTPLNISRQYDTPVGKVITTDDVDTSIVPSGYTINKIRNTPLTVKKNPDSNIIYIDCTIPQVTYKVAYYLDNTLTDTKTCEGEVGEVITSVPTPIYSGYTYSRTDGTPLTLIDSGSVIRVYYVKQETTTTTASVSSLRGSAYLFSDSSYSKNVTSTTQKSGYGFFSYFVLDMSDFYNSNGSVKTTTVSYKTKGTKSCSANTDTCYLNTITTSLTKALYENINVTVTATWTDGLPITNKNGQVVTVKMIKDTSKSTATKWYYRLPANSGSKLNLEKAYIPINWKDNSTWKVTYTATITYGSLNLSVTKNGSDEGHKHNWTEWDYVTKYNPETNQNEIQKDANGHYMTYSYSCSDYFSLLVDVVKSSYTSKSETITATAGVTVKGNMYEDDFTGSKK